MQRGNLIFKLGRAVLLYIVKFQRLETKNVALWFVGAIVFLLLTNSGNCQTAIQFVWISGGTYPGYWYNCGRSTTATWWSVCQTKNPCTAGLYSAQLSVKSCGVESCAHPPPHPCHYPNPLTASLLKWMDLDGEHQEDSTVVLSPSRGQTMCLSICHLLSYLYLFLWSTPQYLVYLVLIVIIFFRLIIHTIKKWRLLWIFISMVMNI